MEPFMGENFLLTNKTAVDLYQNYAKDMPIIDYHCHISPKEIAEDRHFHTITELWLGGDHYKWRQMRSNGIEEKYITGAASDYEKFEAFAATLEKAIGNPLYHWSHLELKTYFGFSGVLTKKNAREVYELCNQKLTEAGFSAKGLIRQSNVAVVCTTDDPVDSLEYHQVLAKDASFATKVLPAWRPDKAMNLEKEDYLSYLEKLSSVSGVTVNSFRTLKEALQKRLSYFASNGCKLSDHGLYEIPFPPASEEEAEVIFAKRRNNETISAEELSRFQAAFLLFMGREYHRLDFTMQLHYGTRRDNNTRLFHELGPDTGFDCINGVSSAENLVSFLNALEETKELPRTILYSLNPSDNAAIGTIIGCFQDASAVGKLQHGSAWWFNDNKTGIISQLTSLANLGLLGNFIGMLTDSRSFLSYTRHEYFRRILCNFIGTLAEQGECPSDREYLGKMVQDISFYNAERYFRF